MRDRAAGSIVLVLDENISGRRIIEGLLASDVPAVPLTEIMERGLPDEEVLVRLSPHQDCYLLTKDSDFHKKPVIKQCVTAHNIGAFVITSHKGKTGDDIVDLVRKAWKPTQRFASTHDRPFVAKILANGRVEEASLDSARIDGLSPGRLEQE